MNTSRLFVLAGLVPLAGCGGGSERAAIPAAVQQCAVCHSFEGDGRGRPGPSLAGIVGARAASGSFAYSQALRSSGITWTPEQLDAFIAAPHKLVPGNRMAFAGEPDPARRREIVAYLQSHATGAKSQ